MTNSPMHKSLSNCFDQCRIERVVVKVVPVELNTTDPTTYLTLFSVLDRNKFAFGVSQEQLKSYTSYKQTQYSFNPSGEVPTHYVNYVADGIFEKSAFYSTKFTPPSGSMCIGVDTNEPTANVFKVRIRMVATFDVTYRGIRHDPSDISTMVSTVQ